MPARTAIGTLWSRNGDDNGIRRESVTGLECLVRQLDASSSRYAQILRSTATHAFVSSMPIAVSEVP